LAEIARFRRDDEQRFGGVQMRSGVCGAAFEREQLRAQDVRSRELQGVPGRFEQRDRPGRKLVGMLRPAGSDAKPSPLLPCGAGVRADAAGDDERGALHHIQRLLVPGHPRGEPEGLLDQVGINPQELLSKL
jgi:hypothetical protein